MQDGKIDLDSDTGKEIGFTSDKFNNGSYLWKVGNYIYVSFIHSKQPGKGSLRNLFQNIARQGLGIKVPTPFAQMEQICRKQGFTKITEWFEAAEENCEVWVKPGRENP